MHLFHERAEETEIEKGGGAEARTVGRWMHVGNIGANGEMDRDGNALFVGGDEDAGVREFYVQDAAVEKLARCFAVAYVEARGEFRKFVDVLTCFASHAELACAEAGFDVFGSVAGECDFEIMNECSAVHGDA